MLKGEHIVLRPLKLTDWENTIQWRNNMAIKQLAMMHPFPITEMVEKEWYVNVMKSTSDRTIYFTITKKDDTPIGFITLNKINYTHQNCGLGIVIGESDNQRQGFGKEAMELIMNYAFNTLNLKKITLEVVENNINAIKLYSKLGFIEEGRLKQHFYSEGRQMDVLIYSIFNNNI